MCHLHSFRECLNSIHFSAAALLIQLIVNFFPLAAAEYFTPSLRNRCISKLILDPPLLHAVYLQLGLCRELVLLKSLGLL